jgi:hypothetical protein
MKLTGKSDASTKGLEDLAKFSPVFDIVSNPVPVSVTIATQPIT